MKLSEILPAKGVTLRLLQDGDFNLMTFLSDPITGQRALTYIDSTNYLENLYNDVSFSCVICPENVAEQMQGDKAQHGILISDAPKEAFFRLHNALSDHPDYIVPREANKIDPSSTVSPLAYIAPTNVAIGKNCVIEEFCSIKENTTIGDNCIIRAHAVIGGEGFQFMRLSDALVPMRHVGSTVLEDNVEIQQASMVDRAIFPWSATVVGEETKVDNFVHIGHACKLGKRCLITAGTILGGSSTIGDDVWMGLNSTTSRIDIGDAARISLGAVVTRNVEESQTVTGNFAIEHSQFIANLKKSL